MIFYKRVELKGICGDCVTGEEREITLNAFIIEANLGPSFQLEGGPTGYESFYVKIEDEFGFLKKVMKDGWIACMGTKDRWDSLKISGEEMRRVFKVLGVIEPPEMKVKINHLRASRRST